MNLNKLILTITLFISLNAKAQDYHLKFPPIQNIINHLFDNYQTLNHSEYVTFEKKPEGYFLKFNDDSSYYEKIWDFKTDKYQKLSLKKSTKSQNKLRNKLLDDYFINYFNFIPFHNYAEASYDVVQMYKNNFEQYPDSIVYGIARSYADYTLNLIGEAYTGFNKKLSYQFNINKGPNALNENQLETFLLYANKTIDLLKLVKRKNPKFQTIVGNIDLKIWNEYVHFYFRLSLIQNEKEALKFLPDNLYDPFMLALAKNNLANCDSNAILFTNGDSDTFPLWYLQAKKGFRKDVYVLNLSLLNTFSYLDGLSRGMLSYKPLDFGFPFKLQNKVNDFYMLSNNNCDEHVEIKDFMREISLENVGKEENGCFIKGNLKWKFERSFFLLQDLAILSLIDKYFGIKSINFAMTTPLSSYLGLYDLFSNSGINLKLSDSLEKKNLNLMVNADKRLDFLLSKLDTTGFKMADSNYEYSRMKSNYANAFLKAFNDCVKSHPKQAKLLVKTMMSIFPKNDPYLITWIIIFNKNGYEKEAEEITESLIRSYNLNTMMKKDLALWDHYLDYLKEYANENEAILKIYKRFEEIRKK